MTSDDIISLMGGPEKAAIALGVHRTRVYAWKRPGGSIPSRYWPRIIAATNGAVTANDFLPRDSEAA